MIRFYSKQNCSKCNEIKEFMKLKDIEFKEMPLENPENFAQLIINNVQVSSAPVLEYEGKFITNREGFLRFLNNYKGV